MTRKSSGCLKAFHPPKEQNAILSVLRVENLIEHENLGHDTLIEAHDKVTGIVTTTERKIHETNGEMTSYLVRTERNLRDG